MASINRVTLIGNLGRDPEMRYLPSGEAVASFSVATTEQWKDKAGGKQERTNWHRIEFFGRATDELNAVPVGALLLAAGFVFPLLSGGYRE